MDPLWHFGGEIWRFQNLGAAQLSTEASNFFRKLRVSGAAKKLWCLRLRLPGVRHNCAPKVLSDATGL